MARLIPRYFLGIDGGGTKTEAAIVDASGNLLGTGRGGPSNYDDVGVNTARNNIGQAVALARDAARLPDTPFTAAFLGMAGVVSPADRANIGAIARDLALAEDAHIGVDHDCRIALAGGLSGRPGIVLIVGTGSSCFGMNTTGATWRAGGWGQLLADEGSSYWLGVEALRIAVGSFDGRLAPTLLLEQVQRHLGLAHMDDIMHRLYVTGMSRAEIASLAPLVIEAARSGDEQAQVAIERGTVALADCVRAVAQRLDLVGNDCEVVLVGGLLRAGATIQQPLYSAILARLAGCRIILAELPPVFGACLLALQLAGLEVDENVHFTLKVGAARLC